MKINKGIKAPVQAGIVDFKGIFQDRIRAMVRDKYFLSTNNIENVMGNTRGNIGRVCRWREATNQMARWMGVALMRA